MVLNGVKNQIADDLLKFSIRATLLNIGSKNQIDIKKDIYRSTTLFVSNLGRIYKILSSSCFDIINELAEQRKLVTLPDKNYRMQLHWLANLD